MCRLRALLPGVPRDRREWAAAGAVGLVVLLLLWQASASVIALVQRQWWLLPVVAAMGAAVAMGRVLAGRARESARAARLATLTLPLSRLDAMDPKAFELAVRDLMIRDGIAARHVGQRGDQAADAIGRDRDGRVFVAQCKHTAVGGSIGSQVMYQIKGTAGPVHGADVGFLVTNGRVTRDARAWGDLNAVHWLDRERLRSWAEEGRSLHEVLRLSPAAGVGRRLLRGRRQ